MKTATTRKPLDIAVEKAEKILLGRAAMENKMKPILDKKLKEIESLDIKIKNLEKQKQIELSNINELLDLAMVQTHALDNGFTVKPDNRYNLEVISIEDFMAWLKKNKKPQEVFKFFKGAMKILALKRFCEKEIADQRINGEIDPKIDGIVIGDMSYRKLTTIRKEKK